LQLVFSDLGTPKPDRWSVYQQLRDELVNRGLPRDTIRFIHEARNDREKAELFAACRHGQVAVLVGSTERMGVGTNVQARAVAEHDLDCPWRPADVQQRTGRLRRQGNHHRQVHVLRYVTEGSFDAYLWQTVQRKAQFITQVMRGRLDVREIEDIGEAALSYQEVKALATGNPLLLDHAQAQADVTRLERLERAHRRDRDSLHHTVRTNQDRIQRLRALVDEVDVATAARVDTAGDRFTMTVDGVRLDTRTEATDRLRTVLAALLDQPRIRDGTCRPVGELGGFTVTATVYRDRHGVSTVGLELIDVPRSRSVLSHDEVHKVALVTRLENRLSGLDKLRTDTLATISTVEAEGQHARTELAQPFRQAEQLHQARARLAHLEEQLKDTATEQHEPDQAPASPADSPTAPPAPEQGGRHPVDLARTAAGDTHHHPGRHRPAPAGDIAPAVHRPVADRHTHAERYAHDLPHRRTAGNPRSTRQPRP
jgi:hypothetical protein